MPIFFLGKSDKPTKKYYIRSLDTNKSVHFGSKNSQTYLDHNDELKKSAYIARHIKRENWNNILTPGALSRWILWNKKTIDLSLKDIKNRFGIDIKKLKRDFP